MLLVHYVEKTRHYFVHIIPQVVGGQTLVAHQKLHHRGQTLQTRRSNLVARTLLSVIIEAHRAELTHKRVVVGVVLGRRLVCRLFLAEFTEQLGRHLLILETLGVQSRVQIVRAVCGVHCGGHLLFAVHAHGALFEQFLYDFQVARRVVVQILRRDHGQDLLDGLDRVLGVVAIFVRALQTPFEMQIQVVAYFGQLLRMLSHVVLKFFYFDFDERQIVAARIDVVYFAFVLRIEATACAT